MSDLAALQSLLDASRALNASQALELAAKDADLAELRACGLPSAASLRRYRAALAGLRAEQARHQAERAQRGAGTPSDAAFGASVMEHSKAMAAVMAELIGERR